MAREIIGSFEPVELAHPPNMVLRGDRRRFIQAGDGEVN